MTDQLSEKVEDFFDGFVEAFKSFNGGEIAALYVAPYLAMDGDGAHRCFNTQVEIVDYFQGVVDYYAEQGCRSCRYGDLDVVPISGHSTLATVTWELLREDHSVIDSWRESYNLMHDNSQLFVFATIDHTE